MRSLLRRLLSGPLHDPRRHPVSNRGPAAAPRRVQNEAWQRSLFWEAFHPRTRRVIVLDRQDVGVCAYERRCDDQFPRLLDIRPEHRHRGIGGLVLRRLFGRARRERCPVTLFAIKADAPRLFYECLGFHPIGENATHYLMQVQP